MLSPRTIVIEGDPVGGQAGQVDELALDGKAESKEGQRQVSMGSEIR